MTIAAGELPNWSPRGVEMVSNGAGCDKSVPKTTPSAKRMLLAVVARKEPPTSSVALGPKRMPLGFSKKKLAVPAVLRVPSISDC